MIRVYELLTETLLTFLPPRPCLGALPRHRATFAHRAPPQGLNQGALHPPRNRQMLAAKAYNHGVGL